MTSTPSPAEHLEGVVAGTPEHPVGTPNWCLDMISTARSQALLLSERESEIEDVRNEARADAFHRKTAEQALAEVRAEVERLKDPERAERFLQITLQRDRAEARLQQAVEGLETYADAAKWSATRVPDGGVGCSSISTGGYTILVSPGAFTMPAAMMDRGEIARTTLAAIQGDSHER